MPSTTARQELRAGARSVAPMLVGVIPFGLVAGAAPVAGGLGGGASIGMSTIIFAGASQLALTDVLADGGAAIVAAIAAWTINLRMVLYSGSLAPHLAHVPLRRRLLMAYLLTDQAYAVSITRWSTEVHQGVPQPDRRVPYYLGAALLLWGNWQITTVIGMLVGGAVPDSLPLEFAVPLVFLVLLVPAISSRPSAVAAGVGGGAAVLAAQLGAGPLSVLIGAVSGILAGAGAELAFERWAAPGGGLRAEAGGPS